MIATRSREGWFLTENLSKCCFRNFGSGNHPGAPLLDVPPLLTQEGNLIPYTLLRSPKLYLKISRIPAGMSVSGLSHPFSKYFSQFFAHGLP